MRLSIQPSARPEKLRDRIRRSVNPEYLSSDVKAALSQITLRDLQVGTGPRNIRLVQSLREIDFALFKSTLLSYYKEEFFCDEVVVVHITSRREFFLFAEVEKYPGKAYQLAKFQDLSTAITAKPLLPVLLEKNMDVWSQLFSDTPKFILIVPTQFENDISKASSDKLKEILVATIFSFTYNLPTEFTSDEYWFHLTAECRQWTPALINIQRYQMEWDKDKALVKVTTAVKNVQNEVRDITSCLYAVALELQSVISAVHVCILVKQKEDGEPFLTKYVTFGAGKVDPNCPDKTIHQTEQIALTPGVAAGWSAIHCQVVRINNAVEYEAICFQPAPVHSIAGCIVKCAVLSAVEKNILAVPIEDFSKDMPLVVELSEKHDGFTEKNKENAQLFAQLASHVVTCAVMLDFREKDIRRQSINTEVLHNVKPVHITSVKQIMGMKTQLSRSFYRKFYSPAFVMKAMPAEDFAGAILYMFNELDILSRWKIRRVVLIRFILTLLQSYSEKFELTWHHACNVTHFAFYLLKKMDVQKNRYLTDLEAFSFIVACLTQAISVSEVNSSFAIWAETDAYSRLRIQPEENLNERHRLVTILQILADENCNILQELDEADYAEFVRLLEWNILATDLRRFQNERLQVFIQLRKYDKRKAEHRRNLLEILMPMCILSIYIKPWDYQLEVMAGQFKEFFGIGDEEIRLGAKPSPIFDRRIAYIPLITMRFINEVVIPIFEAGLIVLPKAEEFLRYIEYTKNLWLLSTKVFQEHVNRVRAEEILQLSSMQERNLVVQENSELAAHYAKLKKPMAVEVAQTIRNAASSMRSSSSVVGMDLVGLKAKRPKRLRNLLMGCCCCSCCCGRKAMHHADFIIQQRHEIEFLEKQNELYENQRRVSLGFSDTGDLSSVLNNLFEIRSSQVSRTTTSTTTESSLGRHSPRKLLRIASDLDSAPKNVHQPLKQPPKKSILRRKSVLDS